MEPRTVIADLASESTSIDRMVVDLDDARWALPTPAVGWTVADQVAHLAFLFRLTGMAASDAAAFQAFMESAKDDLGGAVTAAIKEYPTGSPRALVARWRAERTAGVEALAAVPEDRTVPWLGDSLPPAILASAIFMETFAHGQDIADTLGVRLERTDRLMHVVGFAVLARDFGYHARELTPPASEFRFEITAPSGTVWNFGPQDATDRVSGSAEDFCLLATRRRHRDDVGVTAVGAAADHWLDIAQAFGGPSGPGRSAGQFGSAAHYS